MKDFAAPESKGEQAAAWVFFSALVALTFLLNAWPAPDGAASPAMAAAGLEADWQQKLADPQVAAAAGALGLVFALLFAAGSVAALLALSADSQGKVAYAFAEREQRLLGEGRLPYFELVSCFLLALILVGGLAGALAAKLDSQLPLLLTVLGAGAIGWPLLRGKSPAELRLALGWHRGQGFLREIAAGLRAYLTAWPLLALGLAATALLSRLSERQPSHPILEWITDPSPAALVVAALLAVVWAPLCEESVFRGAFYSYLRGRLGKLGAGLLVGLAFAAIHPQGIAGIPFLLSLALALALTREWRGSIIASVTMHAVHNGLAVLGLVLILR
jgi:membrane protease YdiL (CAAX protease family)